ncbi:MAG: glutathione-regulated potassium-efflux system ancillary protein [Prolixibacteraceae bacterium]|nr:MAG: glutathione-regulated potassium-efflux system ancillary protein [Prolixibacteraceae bacterium]
MYNQDFFFQAMIYLTAAVVMVPLVKKLGLGSVLGYLAAGIIIGPSALGLVGFENGRVMQFAEFGVILMLFVIGLELQPSLLWKMRRTIFGLGSLQVFITVIVIGGIALLLNFKINRAVAIGLIFALSSTAIILQTLTEKGLLQNNAGRSAFLVTLFQDIMVVPMLAIIPLLASFDGKSTIAGTTLNRITTNIELDGWLHLLFIIAVIALIIFGGRFISRYFFRLIAETGMHEVFTAMALLMIIGIALAMHEIGLSPALGTFLAGVVLADNEYRHELETTINPFKGLLIGLFFISVGASINIALFLQKPLMILGFVLLLTLVKFIVLFILARYFRLRKGHDYLFAFLLAPSSEFAFVLISFSKQNQLFDEPTAGLMLLMVTLSMAISPLLLIFNEKALSPIMTRKQNKTEFDLVESSDNPVIIAGFGRFGLVIGRLLLANNYKVTIIDSNPANVEILRKFGFKLFYGDVTRPQVIEQAGIKHAKLVILSMAEYDEALQVADYLKKNYPYVKILARAKDIYHAFEFFKRNVNIVQQEVFDSAAGLGEKALVQLGFSRYEAYRATRTFKHHEKQVLLDLYALWKEDESRFIQETRRFSEQLSEILQAEKDYLIHETDYAWNANSIREEAELEKTSKKTKTKPKK